jgi:hypothetical protein
MLTQQLWNDLTKTMNSRGPDGNWFYPNPCNPAQLTVFYTWKFKGKSTACCPVPGVTINDQMAGMRGAVAGVFYGANQQEITRNISLPAHLLNSDGTPSQAYFEKVPLHIGETINYMTDEQMIKELAGAYANAKCLFEMAFKRTQWEDYLRQPDIARIFDTTPQSYIYDSSIYEGAPVTSSGASYQQAQTHQPPSQHVYHQQPQQSYPPAAQTYPQPAQQPYPPPQQTYPPPGSNQYAPAGHTSPASPFPDINQAKAAGASDGVYQNENGYATDLQGNVYVDEFGQPLMYETLAPQTAAGW